jgi:hypothetical protein
MGRGSAARREAPWRRPPACRHRSARPVARYRPRRDHPIAAGIVPRPVRPHARPSAAHHGEARPPGLDDIDNDLSHACGGDMSTPQKYPPTRHYLQTTSDNRRSVRSRFVYCCAELTDRTTRYAWTGGDGKDHRSNSVGLDPEPVPGVVGRIPRYLRERRQRRRTDAIRRCPADAYSRSARPSSRRALPGSTDTCSACRQPPTTRAISYPAGSSAWPCISRPGLGVDGDQRRDGWRAAQLVQAAGTVRPDAAGRDAQPGADLGTCQGRVFDEQGDQLLAAGGR